MCCPHGSWIKAPYNYAGTDSLTNTIGRIAHALADFDQTDADLVEIVAEAQLVDAQRLSMFAGATQCPKPEIVTCILTHIKAFVPERIPSEQKAKSPHWALDDKLFDEASLRTEVHSGKDDAGR